jgi:uncharacterized protein (TIGR02145 family)
MQKPLIPIFVLVFLYMNILSTNYLFSQNQVNEVRIGNQIWMTEDLDVEYFRNGDLIFDKNGREDYFAASYYGKPAFYDLKGLGLKGNLYNFYCVTDPRGICPTGWHVPSEGEWRILQDFLFQDVGNKLKAKPDLEVKKYDYTSKGFYEQDWVPCSACDWMTAKQFENNGCAKCRNKRGQYVQGKYHPPKRTVSEKEVNHGWNGSGESGFNAVPKGYYDGSEMQWDNDVSWWTSTQVYPYKSSFEKGDAKVVFLNSDDNNINIRRSGSNTGRSIRCVKDDKKEDNHFEIQSKSNSSASEELKTNARGTAPCKKLIEMGTSFEETQVIGFLQDMQLSQNSRPRNEEDIKNIETRIEVLNALIDKRDNHTSINLKVETAVEDYKKLIESSRKEYFFNLGTCAMKTKFKVTKTVIRN